MTRREAWLTALAIFAVAVAVRAVAATLVAFPTPEDTTYYWGVARNLVEGRGLVSDALWSYGTPARDPTSGLFGLFFPRPAFEIWLPLPALLAVLPMTLLRSTSYGAAQVVPVLLGALVPVLGWRIAADVAEERALPPGRARTLAAGAGLVAAVFLPLVLHSTLLDSTAAFGVPALAACLLMVRLARDPRGGRLTDPRLLALGALIGIACLSRNEAAWVGIAWALMAWAGTAGATRATRLRMIAVPALVALAVVGPWLVRSWLVFGTPLPGQAAANALSLSGFDIFAWHDPPTLARYLAAGPAEWIRQRIDGLGHNLVSVLLVPGAPVGFIGLAALPWLLQSRALRPLLLVSGLTFLVTTLAFPVATTWGTFLHASFPPQVLLLVASLVALDAGIAALGRRLGWHRPIAWFGPLFAGFTAILILAAGMPAYGRQASDIEARYRDLGEQLAAAGAPLSSAEPVIANHPIWLAEVERVPTLALPDEEPTAVVDLARTFGARLLVIDTDAHGRWPAVLDTDGPDAACFAPLTLDPAHARATGADRFRAWRIVCP